MGTQNRFKYICAECKWTGFFRLNEFVRRSRPRCGGCGSTFLDPVTSEAKGRILEHDAVTTEQLQHRLKQQNFPKKPQNNEKGDQR